MSDENDMPSVGMEIAETFVKRDQSKKNEKAWTLFSSTQHMRTETRFYATFEKAKNDAQKELSKGIYDTVKINFILKDGHEGAIEIWERPKPVGYKGE